MAPDDLGLTGLAVVIHALRDDHDGIRVLLDVLTHDEVRIVTEHALLGLGQAVRECDAVGIAEGIALQLQHSIIEGTQS
ncbi:hypothetical protein [Streptomyces sp. NPDC002467]|uniref:hypothetical protein n=1 Tax=Streptomyces sp. NPDC002467 TaxID=3364647 RepID=UPI00368EE330